MDFDEDRSNIWLIYNENGERKCVMTAKKSESNWLREVCPAESAAIANVLAISHRYVKSFLAHFKKKLSQPELRNNFIFWGW